MSAIVIPLPWDKPPLTGNRTRGNPYAQAVKVKNAALTATYAIIDAKPRPVVGAEVTLHFRPATRHRRDADGMAPTLKVCLDALVRTKPIPHGRTVLPDDSWVHVPAATCRIHPPNGEPPALWLELTEITEWETPA